jgi:hypothetical protein
MDFKGAEGFVTFVPWYQRSIFSLEFWVLLKDVSIEPQALISGSLYIHGPKPCDINGWMVLKVNNTILFGMGGTNICEEESLNTTIPIGTWTHITVTIGNQATLYKNGALVIGRNIVGSLNYGNGSAPFRVGIGSDFKSNLNNTSLDEIRFWSNTISSYSINQNYLYSLIKPMPPELLAYWRFNHDDHIIQDDSLYSRNVEEVDSAFSQNCVVVKCLCDLDQHCVPTRNLMNCPTTTSSSFTTTTSTPSTSTTTTTTTTSETTSSDTKTETLTTDIDTMTSTQNNETNTTNLNSNMNLFISTISIVFIIFL